MPYEPAKKGLLNQLLEMPIYHPSFYEKYGVGEDMSQRFRLKNKVAKILGKSLSDPEVEKYMRCFYKAKCPGHDWHRSDSDMMLYCTHCGQKLSERDLLNMSIEQRNAIMSSSYAGRHK